MLRDRWIRQTEINRGDSVAQCPECGHEHGDMWEALREDYDKDEFECEGCGCKLVCTLTISHNYCTEAKLP